MNRERLLFAVVLAILALWYFVLREPAEVREGIQPRSTKLAILPVGSTAIPLRTLRAPAKGIFTRITNENPHPRPVLDAPEARGLSNVWPATSYSVAVERYGILRRSAAKPQEGEATLELPERTSEGAGGAEAPVEERVDRWTNYNRPTVNEGRVAGVLVGGLKVEEPESLPAPGAAVLDRTYYYYAVLLEVDPQRALDEGVTQVEARFKVGGTIWQKFPDQIHSISMGVKGKQKGWWEGLRGVLQLPAKGFQPRLALGRQLIQDGVNAKDTTLLE